MAWGGAVDRVGSTIVKTLVASLVVGILLSMFSVIAHDLLDDAMQIVSVVAGLFEWALDYTLLGAVVIVPIWLIVAVFRHARGRRGD